MKYKLLAILILNIITNVLIGQNKVDKTICLNLRTENFIIGLDNPIDISYSQIKQIELEDITAVFQHYKTKREREIKVFERYGSFFIRPDSAGYITISVKTIDGLKSKTLRTKSMIATGRLSRLGANHKGGVIAGEFKIQQGLTANLEGYDIDARCNVLNYEIIRINNKNLASKHFNQGGKFDDQGKQLITQAKSGDLYIFRKIYYKCPGDDYEKKLADMTFEIK